LKEYKGRESIKKWQEEATENLGGEAIPFRQRAALVASPGNGKKGKGESRSQEKESPKERNCVSVKLFSKDTSRFCITKIGGWGGRRGEMTVDHKRNSLGGGTVWKE